MAKSLVLAGSVFLTGTLGLASDPAPASVAPPAWPPVPATPAPAAVTPLAPPSGQPLNVATPGAPVAPNGPKIQFDAAVFDFGRAMSGEIVKHSYYFTNTGNQDLLLSNVQPQCGCTATGEWTRQVKPGQSGVIPIQFNSANYNTPVTKIITVTSNDKTQPMLPLQLKGTVWKPIDVNPQVLVLNLRSEAPYSSGTVHITNSLESPLWLSLPESNNHVFGAELRTNIPGRDYLVIISNNTVLPAGGIQGQITLKTSVTNLPVVSVLAYANMQAALTISPPQIMLPATPIPTNQLIRYITLINNTTNPLTLSDTTINSKDVQIATQTLHAGRYYTITLTFPPDFEVPPGQSVAFSTRTSNPQFELVKVPVYQTPRPPGQPKTAVQQPQAPPPGAVVLKRPAPPAPNSALPATAQAVVAPPLGAKAPPAPVSLPNTALPPLPPSQ